MSFLENMHPADLAITLIGLAGCFIAFVVGVFEHRRFSRSNEAYGKWIEALQKHEREKANQLPFDHQDT